MRIKTKCRQCGKDIVVEAPEDTGGFTCNACVPVNSPARDGINESVYTQVQNVKQYIILRRDAKTVTGEPVSAHKLAVMTAHASMAFIATRIEKAAVKNEDGTYSANITIEEDVMEEWFGDAFTKVLLSAKSLNDLKKAVKRAEEIGLKEGEDFFLIKDNCYTELVPDDGEQTCFIGIGFRPLDVDVIRPVTKKYQLYT